MVYYVLFISQRRDIGPEDSKRIHLWRDDLL
jgi:hypothetical protein